MKSVLIADSNNFYFNIMKKIYETNGYQVIRAKTSEECWRIVNDYGIGFFNLLVTDLAIESQLAGLFLALRLKKAGFRNPMYFASSGFNETFYYFISTGFLKLLGIQRLIPKSNFHQMNVNTLQRFFI